MYTWQSRLLSVAALLAGMAGGAPPSQKTRNVVFVMTDGLRWQEVFRGADASLIDKENGGVSDVPALRRTYWRDSADERREALMPFLWREVARAGQIFGNRDLGANAAVTNEYNISYP